MKSVAPGPAGAELPHALSNAPSPSLGGMAWTRSRRLDVAVLRSQTKSMDCSIHKYAEWPTQPWTRLPPAATNSCSSAPYEHLHGLARSRPCMCGHAIEIRLAIGNGRQRQRGAFDRGSRHVGGGAKLRRSRKGGVGLRVRGLEGGACANMRYEPCFCCFDKKILRFETTHTAPETQDIRHDTRTRTAAPRRAK